MGYLDHHLHPNEEIRYRTERHGVFILAPALVMAIGLVLTIAVSEAAAILLVVGAIWFVTEWLKRLTSEFVVTNQRVIRKLGVFRRHVFDLPLERVEAIALEQGIFGRLWGYGALVVAGTGGSVDTLERIAEPMEFRRQVQQQQLHPAPIRVVVAGPFAP